MSIEDTFAKGTADGKKKQAGDWENAITSHLIEYTVPVVTK